MTNYFMGWRPALTVALTIGAASAMTMRASAADLVVKAPPRAAIPADVNSSVLWLSSDFKRNVAAGVVGGLYAFNGNLDMSGWLVRGQYTYVGFDFDQGTPPGGTGHGNFAEGSAAIGYQVVSTGWVASAFVGADYQNFDFSPPSAADPRIGNRGGAVFFGRIATTGGAMYPLAIEGSYSTANNTYWVRGRAGARFGGVTVGPEAVGLGNVAFDEVRVGGFASYDITSKVILQGDLGYANATRGENGAGGRGGSGVYGGATLVLLH